MARIPATQTSGFVGKMKQIRLYHEDAKRFSKGVPMIQCTHFPIRILWTRTQPSARTGILLLTRLSTELLPFSLLPFQSPFILPVILPDLLRTALADQLPAGYAELIAFPRQCFQFLIFGQRPVSPPDFPSLLRFIGRFSFPDGCASDPESIDRQPQTAAQTAAFPIRPSMHCQV